MQHRKPKSKATGLYIAIALIAYALVGALSNDIYLPGRSSSGLHLRNEAVLPALLAITLFALTIPLDYFRESPWFGLTLRTLQVGAVLAMALTLYRVGNSSGKQLATTEECQATYAKIERFVGGSSRTSGALKFLQEMGSQCPTAPILKSYAACIDRAEKAEDFNLCERQSEMLRKPKNAR